jgi:hypothetical protein
MDFVERIFAISPDGGGGGLEAAILCALILASGLLLYRLRAGQRR